jgi:hypothetical protein
VEHADWEYDGRFQMRKQYDAVVDITQPIIKYSLCILFVDKIVPVNAQMNQRIHTKRFVRKGVLVFVISTVDLFGCILGGAGCVIGLFLLGLIAGILAFAAGTPVNIHITVQVVAVVTFFLITSGHLKYDYDYSSNSSIYF